jgi:hypothetical protein
MLMRQLDEQQRVVKDLTAAIDERLRLNPDVQV